MNRRTFLRGMLLAAAGLMVPPLALEEPVRRLWALDGTMLGAEPEIATAETMAEAESFAASAGRVMALVEDGIAGFDQLPGFHAPTPETVEVFLSDFAGGRGVYPVARVIRGTENMLRSFVVYDEAHDSYEPRWVWA